ncbi:uncharacterized protein LOC107819941 isoform X2 [Nicotiana tabacum]|uniref:Uncharacterized protein isoform X1 n=2 Tax=Nicotiana tabacum TaxID=4097 RepID=A0A1S4CL12_TOBAC|nr:PREDICTED: uncharacterized protein LOC107819941 isoform X1 [Nicotiana tabacum]XP_016501622.1 PREDICTED: uncharacterized protein LOC107819941 isoform X1 [Nicotiana tabacum]XP_016501623.1 PREDICTED: uncharacterized protein LOC107819941 isoform X1 [Nicotiana tabacum]XP_016501624.1 PREDICTED: uncharacterized protein LOC107819941 isoform X1 [Nicotiana tabacum]
MEHRYTIHEITPFTRDWTCKIQVVDKIRPKISRDHRVNFQTTIVQDENEDQICIITYGPEVAHYDNLVKHFHTYLISAAKVREPSRFAIPMHNFEWVLDTFSIVEEVIDNNEEESMLPLPSRLNMVSFADIEKQIPGDEFDLVAVVANCGTMKYQGSENRRFQEAILIDDKAKDNNQMLIEYTLKSTSASPSTLNVAPFEDQILSISSIPSQSTEKYHYQVNSSFSSYFYALNANI